MPARRGQSFRDDKGSEAVSEKSIHPDIEALRALRRALDEEGEGALLRFSAANGAGALNVRRGRFLTRGGDAEVVAALGMLAAEPAVASVRPPAEGDEWKPTREDARALVIRAVYGAKLSDERVLALARFFSAMPPIRVRLAPMYPYADFFPGFTPYMRLHADSLLQGELRLASWLGDVASAGAVGGRVRLLLVMYVLGLIQPRPKPRPSIFGRLMNAIRGV